MAIASSGPLRWLQLWLLLVNGLSVVLGLALAFAFSTPFFRFYRDALAGTFFSASAVSGGAEAYMGWSMALIGASTVGWAVTNLFVVYVAVGRGERWSFAALIVGTLTWALVEVAVSLPAEALVEIAFVVPAALSVILPVSVAWSRGGTWEEQGRAA